MIKFAKNMKVWRFLWVQKHVFFSSTDGQKHSRLQYWGNIVFFLGLRQASHDFLDSVVFHYQHFCIFMQIPVIPMGNRIWRNACNFYGGIFTLLFPDYSLRLCRAISETGGHVMTCHVWPMLREPPMSSSFYGQIWLIQRCYESNVDKKLESVLKIILYFDLFLFKS